MEYIKKQLYCDASSWHIAVKFLGCSAMTSMNKVYALHVTNVFYKIYKIKNVATIKKKR
jgi:hypothetical protein